jgi:hypothetical protein
MMEADMIFFKTLRRAIAFSGISALALTAISSPAQTSGGQYLGVMIENNFRPGQQIVVQNGTTQSIVRSRGQGPTLWDFEPLGGGRYRIKNRADGTYLHLEGELPQSTNVPVNYATSWWYLEPVSNGFFRIRNHYRGTYLHTERNRLEAGAAAQIPANYATSWWKLNGDPRSAQNISPDRLDPTREAKDPNDVCRSTATCYVQIVGLLAEKRTEFSNDEVFVYAVNSKEYWRFPKVYTQRVNPDPAQYQPGLGERAPFDQDHYYVMEMNENTPGLRSWNICHTTRLDRDLDIYVKESDKFDSKQTDNGGTDSDDPIGRLKLSNNSVFSGNFTQIMTESGGKYRLLYNIRDSEDKFPNCTPSARRDPDADIPSQARQPSYCEKYAERLTGVPKTAEMAVVYFGTVGACELNGGDPSKI